MTTRYRYLKKYYPKARDFNLAFKIFSLGFFFLGLVLVGNAVTPILSYQINLSPNIKQEEVISPLSSQDLRESFLLSSQVLGDKIDQSWSADIKNWFPNQSFPEYGSETITSYKISIPKLRIVESLVKVGVDLNKSLVHYPGTPHPGKPGNAVIFGHSVLPAFFNPKNYMTIFSTLPTLKKGEQVLVDYDGIRYVYLVESLKEVSPNDNSILAQKYDDSYLTLVTCVPPGTLLRRLLVTAKLEKQ
jgi:sortase A